MSNLPQKPNVADPILQKWINTLHRYVNAMPGLASAPPNAPSNIKVTPGPGQNLLTFTAGNGATSHLIQISPYPVWNPSTAGNAIIDIGASSQFTHSTGVPYKTYYYWIIAVNNGFKSHPVGPVSAETLSLTTSTTEPNVDAAQPGNVVESQSTQLPTTILPGLTRGGRAP